MRRACFIVTLVMAAAGCQPDTRVEHATDAGASSLDGGVADARADAGIDAGLTDAGPPDGGGLPGDPCEEAADCASADSPSASLYPTACITQVNGWKGGYCVDFCTLPTDPAVSPKLAQADCPSGSICLPRDQGSPTGSPIGVCMKECTVDSDCRTGEDYYCRHEFYPGMPPAPVSFENGYCAPPHCKSRGCPTSFVCGC